MGGFDFRLPNFTGTDREQLAQMRSYLYQFIPQLQWALNTIETTSVSTTVVKQAPQVTTSQKEDNAEATFNSLKALIIKSADIVDAYYEEINKRLSGLYVAESDFGTYAEATDLRITENSEGVNQAFSNTQIVADTLSAVSNTVTDMSENLDDVTGRVGQAESDLVSINNYVIDVKANIKTGILYYVGEDGKETDDMVNGTPVYGLEIGQRNKVNGVETFNKYARFIANRLSFYDQNDSEVAYISDYKLFIRNVEITSSYKIGGYMDTVTASGGVITKWVGKE